MGPILMGVALGSAGLYVLDQMGFSIRKLHQQPRPMDLQTCEADPTGKYRVLKHAMRAGVQQQFKGLTLKPVMQDRYPIPGWYCLLPKSQPNEIDAYTAVGEAQKRGLWTAIRLDSVHDCGDGVVSISTREETLKLCSGPQPFAILVRPRERTNVAAPKAKAEDPKQGQLFDEKAAVIETMMKAMSLDERAKLIAYFEKQGQANGDYVQHSQDENEKAAE